MINGIEWEIERVPRGHEGLEVNKKECYGTTNYIKCKIFVADYMKKGLFKQVLLHELTHAVIFSFGNYIDKRNIEEYICDFVGVYNDTLNNLSNMILETWNS